MTMIQKALTRPKEFHEEVRRLEEQLSKLSTVQKRELAESIAEQMRALLMLTP